MGGVGVGGGCKLSSLLMLHWSDTLSILFAPSWTFCLPFLSLKPRYERFCVQLMHFHATLSLQSSCFTGCPFIHSYTHSSIHALIHSFIHSSMYACMYPFALWYLRTHTSFYVRWTNWWASNDEACCTGPPGTEKEQRYFFLDTKIWIPLRH